MKIGVKYCGGCNSIYNRGRQVELLKQRFSEHEYCTPGEQKTCDIWLVVCGCMRACASTEGLTAVKRLFILPTERSFQEVRDYLEREHIEGMESDEAVPDGQDQKSNRVSCCLRIGQEAMFSKTFFKDDVDRFAALTGDRSRLHTDAEFARQLTGGRPVVHGVLAASLISTVMGMQLPGEGTVLVEEKIRFLKPVYYGDTITAKVRFLSCRENHEAYVGTFSGICVNQNGEVTAAAICRQRMDKKLFLVENPRERADIPQEADLW